MSISFYALTATGELVDHNAPNAPWSPNFAVGNAPRVLEVLGLPVDPEGDHYGEIPGADLLGRVLLALALVPADAGVPVTQTGNMIDCGRPEGYLQRKLGELRTLADWSARRGCTVAWG